MDENRLEGAAREVGGQMQDLAGKITDDPKVKVDAAVNQAAGAAQRAYGQVKDTVREYGGDYGSHLLDQIEEAGDALAEQVDQRPITALLVAAGIGFLLALATKPSPKVVYRRR